MSEMWNQRYSEEEYFYGKEPNDFLVSCLKYIPQRGKVLCLGEGEGRNSVFLATLGFQVTAVDSSSKGLEKLDALASSKNVRVESVCADLKNFEIGENKWDAIVSIWCHTTPELRKKIHSDSMIGLKKNGVFILEAYSPEQLKWNTGGPKDIQLLVTQNILHEELRLLKINLCQEVVREVSEGLGHKGKSAVTQFVGEKI